MRPELCWDDLAKIRDLWDGPMYVKGILDPDDAAAAVRLGADGIVVSNHGDANSTAHCRASKLFRRWSTEWADPAAFPSTWTVAFVVAATW